MKRLVIMVLTVLILFTPEYCEREAHSIRRYYSVSASTMMLECHRVRVRHRLVGLSTLTPDYAKMCEGIPMTYDKSEPIIPRPKKCRGALGAILRLFKLCE